MTSSLRLIASDLDGTLLANDHKTISARNIAAIRRAVRAGILFVPTTGRCISVLPVGLAALEPYPYLMASNGGVIEDTAAHEILFHRCFDPSCGELLWELLGSRGYCPELYMGRELVVDEWSFAHLDSFGLPERHFSYIAAGKARVVPSLEPILRERADHIDQLVIAHELDADVWEEYHGIFDADPRFEATRSEGHNLGLLPGGVTKGSGLRELCSRLGIPLSEAAAFGNADNDTEMCSVAGWGVCVGHESELLYKAAKYHAPANDEDGVAWFLENVLGI